MRSIRNAGEALSGTVRYAVGMIGRELLISNVFGRLWLGRACCVFIVSVLLLPSSVDAAGDSGRSRADESSVTPGAEAGQWAAAARASAATVKVFCGGEQSSGVLVTPDGLMLTAAHGIRQAIENDLPIEILFPRASGSTSNTARRLARIVFEDQRLDVAILQVEESASTGEAWLPIALKPSSVGKFAAAVGFPAAAGAFESPHFRIGTIQSPAPLISTCPLSIGDSGGPLLTAEGRVCGLHRQIADSVTENHHTAIQPLLSSLPVSLRARILDAAAGYSERESTAARRSFAPLEVRPGVQSCVRSVWVTQEDAVDDSRRAAPKLWAATLVGQAADAGSRPGHFPPFMLVKRSRVSDWRAVRVVAVPDGQVNQFAGVVFRRVAEFPSDDLVLCVPSDGWISGESITESWQTWRREWVSLLEAVAVTGGSARGDWLRIEIPSSEGGGASSSYPDNSTVWSLVSSGTTQEVSVPGFLGVRLSPAADGVASGLLVEAVSSESPALVAGLRPDDRIVAVDGIPTPVLEPFSEHVRNRQAGDWLRLQVRRDRDDPAENRSGFMTLFLRIAQSPKDMLSQTEFLGGRSGVLSQRRTGFPAVVKTAFTILPEGCGFPAHDVAGRFAGVLAARRFRETTLVIPASRILELIRQAMPELP